MNPTYKLRPVGTVHSAAHGVEIRVEPEYRDALTGLEGFSHVLTLYWFHLNDNDEARSLRVSNKPYSRGPDTLGIFATRSPLRPNPIAVTSSRILGVDTKSGVITVDCSDAEEGTPVLDLKPYHPSIDRVRDAKVPAWCAHWPRCVEENATFDWSAEFNF